MTMVALQCVFAASYNDIKTIGITIRMFSSIKLTTYSLFQ